MMADVFESAAIADSKNEQLLTAALGPRRNVKGSFVDALWPNRVAVIGANVASGIKIFAASAGHG